MASFSLSAFKIRLIYSILNDCFNKDIPLDQSYAQHFKKIKLENDEQSLIIRLVNDLLRRLSLYTHVAGYKKIKDAKKHINKLICALHIIHNWPVPKDLNDCEDFSAKQAKIRLEEANNIDNFKYGCPAWLDTLCYKELGLSWQKEKETLGSEPKRFIRVNTLKTKLSALRTSLRTEHIKTALCENHPDALEVVGNAALFRTQSFKDGLFEQQDIGSQTIAPFLKITPGLKIIDACAGAGGKTLHLAALSEGKGSIIAMDDKEWKLKSLKERARRAGAFNIETRLIENSKVIKRLAGKADRVLLDVPCSGLGVLKRNFDTKWSDRTQEILELIDLQADILDRYSQMTAINGLLVYSTCSILPSENHKQIEKFLSNHPEFEFEEEVSIMPSEGGDGFYMARMKRIS
ncbi:MAG: RsmB/NOP family class I SAM-dependent RNA methyltransferase [Succinivibrionaceae bacterium]